ncbi:LOW QUALITY PROTEIN: hypothetical protein V2J09_006128 [Rumex salicifolius]
MELLIILDSKEETKSVGDLGSSPESEDSQTPSCRHPPTALPPLPPPDSGVDVIFRFLQGKIQEWSRYLQKVSFISILFEL